MRPFEEIVDEYGPAVMRMCRVLLDPVDADDAWSETFLAAMRAYPDLRPDSNVRSWLVTIAHNKSIDQIRSSKRAPLPSDDLPEMHATEGIPNHRDEDLRAAVDRLPPKQRSAVIYHYLGDVPYDEVGVLLDTNEAAARRSAADGIANLRKSYLKGTTR